jgi:uncharacterized protein (DUF1015 family)
VPEIRPFAGVLYRVPDAALGSVLAPPYDVIGPEYQGRLYERHPHNVVRLVLNRTPGDAGYAEAGDTYRRWLAEGVLAADPEPALYLLEQSFAHEGRALRRYGLLARFRAEDPERGDVLPHEQTRAAPREDRYRVLMATRANFSPIFLMFPDSGRFAERVAATIVEPAAVSYTDDAEVRHRVWRVTAPAAIAAFGATLAGTRAYIADGHHRYAVALRCGRERGPDAAWTCGYFTPMEAPGLLVLPYHRVLSQGPALQEVRKALEGLFLLSDAPDAAAAASAAANSTMPYAFGIAQSGGGALVAEALPEAQDLVPSDTPACLAALDAFFAHQVLLPRLLAVPEEAVRYVHALEEVEASLAQRSSRLALLMRPTPPRQIAEVADARQSMPTKSTFFHPKLPSGLVIHPLAGLAGG